MSIKRARQVLKIEADSIRDLIKRIDSNFSRATDLISKCKGRVVVTGMGKAGLIGQKISSTMSSLGTPSLWVHCAEAIHGDLGRIKQDDVVIALSNSGETEEVTRLLPLIKKIGSELIAITGNKKSTLAKHADVVLDVNVKKEACPLGLAPTSSTTCMLAIGDALAVSIVDRKSFRREDFAFLHPGGSLGRELLLRVEDIMRKGRGNPIVREAMLVKDVLVAITKARAGAASVVDKNKKLIGIFTDGDLRRHLDGEVNLANLKIKDVMTKHPTVIHPECLAVEALKMLKDKKIDELPVVDKNNRPIGMVDVQDLLKAGFV